MTIGKVISKIKESNSTAVKEDIIIDWLNQLEWQIYREVILTHDNKDNIEYNGYSTDTDRDTKLIAVEPYDEIYYRYVLAMIADTNAETNEYNNQIALFNSVYDEYKRWYNRNYRPKGLHNFRYYGG